MYQWNVNVQDLPKKKTLASSLVCIPDGDYLKFKGLRVTLFHKSNFATTKRCSIGQGQTINSFFGARENSLS